MSAGTCSCALPCALDRQSTRLQERIEALARVYTVGAQELTLAFLYMALARVLQEPIEALAGVLCHWLQLLDRIEGTWQHMALARVLCHWLQEPRLAPAATLA